MESRYRTENETATTEAIGSRQPPFESSYRSEEYPPQPTYPQEFRLTRPHHATAGGLAQMFGLHPGIAFLAIIADTMIFSGDIISGGLLLPVAFGGAAVLGIITHMAQKSWFGDDDRNALIKALIVGLLTAIPSPLPYVLFLPASLLGFFRRKRG